MSQNRHKVDTHECGQERPRHTTAILFDQQKKDYHLGSSVTSDTDLDYWFNDMMDETGKLGTLNASSCKEEAMMDDKWCLDDEEVLQTHPDTVSITGDSWEHQQEEGYHSVDYNNLDVTSEDDINISCDYTNDRLMIEQTESCPLIYTVVLPYTGISKCLKGARVGLNIQGGVSSEQGLVAFISEVDHTGPGYIIGGLTAGCIVYKWNGVSLLNKTYEQTRGVLSERILSNELSLLVCNNSPTEILSTKVERQSNSDTKKTSRDQSRRQSVISCSSQQQWVFEERFIEEEQDPLVEIPSNGQSCGCVQLSMIYSRSQLAVTLHQAILSSTVPIDSLASITLIGEGLSNPDELLLSQVSEILSQSINPVWNHKFEPMKLPKELLSCTGLHLTIWHCKSDEQYSFVGEVFLNLSPLVTRDNAPGWYSLGSHDPNLPQLATPAGVKKRATINKFFDRVLSTKRATKSSSLKQDLSRSRKSPSLFQRLTGKKITTGRSSSEKSRMLVMRPKVVVNESTPAECDSPNSCHQQLPPNLLNQQMLTKKKQDTQLTDYSTNARTMEVEAVVEPHTYQPAWGLETEVHKKPHPDLHGFEVRQEQLGSPSSSSGYTSVHQSETSSTNRNSGFSNYSTSSTESPDVMWHGVDDTGIKCSTMIRRSCSMNSYPVTGGNSSEYQTTQVQDSDDYPRLKSHHRSNSVEILVDVDSSTELPQTDASYNSSEEISTNRVVDQRPENLIMSFKMKYNAVQQPSAPQKSRIFFIKAKKIKAPFRLFRSKHASDSSQGAKMASSSSSSPEGSKVCLTQQRKELGIGQFIPKLDHLQEPCGRIRFSLVQHRRLLLKIRTLEERSPTVSANECCIKATLVQGKEVICKKKVSTTLNSATNPLAEMYLDSHGCTDRMHLHIVITKGSRLSKKYIGEVWVNMKWADLSGLSSWYQLYT